MVVGSTSAPVRCSGEDGRINRRKKEDNGDQRLRVGTDLMMVDFWRERKKEKGEKKERADVRPAETG